MSRLYIIILLNLTYMQSTSCEMLGWVKHKLESRLLGETLLCWQRSITLLTNKAMVSPVVYGCESWTIKKVQHWRTDAFELWCWGRLSRVPWTSRRSKQSVLKEISPEYSLEGLMLKLQYFWPPAVNNWLLQKDPDAGRVEGRRRRGSQTMRWLDGVTDSSWWWTGRPSVLQSIGLAKSQTRLNDWTELNIY